MIVECKIHCVGAYTDSSEPSLGVRIIIRTVEEFKGTLGHVIL